MRLWSLHPALLDRQGLVACWREALLAQAVLGGRTRGYTRHPQLARFRDQPDPERAIGRYLAVLADEADRRGYRFDRSRIAAPYGDGKTTGAAPTIEVTVGQLAHEWAHLQAKLAVRSPDRTGGSPAPHPMFGVVPGPVADWER